MITSTPTFGADIEDPDAGEPDPLALMQKWLPPNASELRPLMTLSTIDVAGYPDARNVLVSAASADGLYFHTDSRSRKAAQLAVTPRAAGTLAWPDIGRQLVVQGDVLPTSLEESGATFAARSRYLQLLAWANSAATAELPLAGRRSAWADFSAGHPDGSLAPPPTWVGYLLHPVRLTFWRGDPDGPSNRTEYTRTQDGWTITHLPG